VLTLHGSQFRNAACIVASPPCQAYSYRAMPWKKAKALPPPDNALFEACFRIQREASEAAGRYIPMVVENVCGAQRWVGSAKWHYGSYYLWGDVPALMPYAHSKTMKATGPQNANGELHRQSINKMRDCLKNDWLKVNGFNFHEHEKTGKPGRSFQSAAVENTGVKVAGLNWSGSDKPGYKAQAFNSTAEARMRDTSDGLKFGGGWWHDATNNLIRKASSRSSARKQASALIAKIPFPLAAHIARVFKAEC
jgi:hypothetical protein